MERKMVQRNFPEKYAPPPLLFLRNKATAAVFKESKETLEIFDFMIFGF